MPSAIDIVSPDPNPPQPPLWLLLKHKLGSSWPGLVVKKSNHSTKYIPQPLTVSASTKGFLSPKYFPFFLPSAVWGDSCHDVNSRQGLSPDLYKDRYLHAFQAKIKGGVLGCGNCAALSSYSTRPSLDTLCPP